MPELKLHEPNKAYREMAEAWELPDALLGGTRAMRDEGEKYLPKEEAEPQRKYDRRRERSFLFNGYKDALSRAVSKPMSKPVQAIGGELGPITQRIVDDADMLGHDLTDFSRPVLWDSIHRGLTHIMYDAPASPADRESELRGDGRPRLIHVPAKSLFKWFFSDESEAELDAVYLKDAFTQRDGEHGEKEVQEITIWTPTTWQVFQAIGGGEEFSAVTEPMFHTFGRVPIVTSYANQTGPMTGAPAFESLAWLNLAHWQGTSDYRNLLRVAQVPMIYEAGAPMGEDDKSAFVVSVGHVHRSPDTNYKIGVAETSGRALSAGRQDLMDIEEKMIVLGMRPFLERTGDSTATARAIDESQTVSDVQTWVRATEAAITKSVTLAAGAAGEAVPADFKVDIFQDFTVGLRGSEEIDSLIKIRNSREIDRPTFLEEIKRRGILSESADLGAIEEAVTEEVEGDIIEPDPAEEVEV